MPDIKAKIVPVSYLILVQIVHKLPAFGAQPSMAHAIPVRALPAKGLIPFIDTILARGKTYQMTENGRGHWYQRHAVDGWRQAPKDFGAS